MMAPSPARFLFSLPTPNLTPPPPVRRRRRARAGAARCAPEAAGGFVVVDDDLCELLQNEPRRDQLLEVILDLGRRPEARFLCDSGGQYLRDSEIGGVETVTLGDNKARA